MNLARTNIKYRCSLCGSDNTESKAYFNGSEYKLKTKCFNSKCISNIIDRHPLISSGTSHNTSYTNKEGEE